MTHEERIELIIRPAARKAAKMVRAKLPNLPKSKTLIDRRMIEIEEAKKDGCSAEYIAYLVAKLPA